MTPARLVELIGRLCDDELNDAEFDELEAKLASSAEARRVYHMVVATHFRLEQIETLPLAEPPDETADESPTGSVALWRPAREALNRPVAFSSLVAGMFIAAALLVLAQWTLPAWREPAKPTSFDRSRFVAEVIRSRGAEWSQASLVEGASPIDLYIDEPVELLAGSVALRFVSGAVAMVEGPATFIPQGRNHLRLADGKLAARVPRRAVGFLVSTPTVDVIDLGTEFSVEAAAREATVHVITGSVEVQRAGQEPHDEPRAATRYETRNTRHVLMAGQAARFGNSSSQGFYAQETEMNRSLLISMMALLATPAMADAGLIAHWKMDETVQGSSMIDSAGNYHGATSSLLPAMNQPGKFGQAYQFTPHTTVGNSSRVPLDSHVGAFGTMGIGSITGWLKTDGTPRGAIFSFREQDISADRLTLEMSANGRLRFLVRGANINHVDLTTTASFTDGDWHHVAIIQDGVAAKLFIDGAQVPLGTNVTGGAWFSTISNPSNMSLGYEEYKPIPTHTERLPFRGLLDDFAVFSHALTEEELQNVIQFGAEHYVVPEPSSAALSVLGVAGGCCLCAARRWRKRRRACRGLGGESSVW